MRVLVVEDELRLAGALARGLAQKGFEVEVAHDGGTAYETAVHGRFDAIVLDLMLPVLSGSDVCRRLRAGGITTPILMLTAKHGENDEADGLDLGADDYLRKPFSYVVLLARLNALLRRDALGRPPLLVAGDLVLDPATSNVWRDGEPIELTPREVALLAFLMRNAGRTRSKLDILQQVWGADSDRDPNVVEVYVGYLRRKIDQPFGIHTLHTVRGQGYQLQPGG